MAIPIFSDGMFSIARSCQPLLDASRTSSLDLALSVDPVRDCIMVHASFDNGVHKASGKEVFVTRRDLDNGQVEKTAVASLQAIIYAVSPPKMVSGEYEEIMAAQSIMDDLNG